MAFKSNLLVKYNGNAGRLKPFKIRIEGAWESRKVREQGKPWVAWWCRVWNDWLFPCGVYSARWEVSQRKLLSSGVSGNCGGATWSRVFEGLDPPALQKIPPVVSQGDRGICSTTYMFERSWPQWPSRWFSCIGLTTIRTLTRSLFDWVVQSMKEICHF